MKVRRSMLVLLAVLALSGALLSTALAAPRSQESATTDVRPERAEEAFLGLVTTALNDPQDGRVVCEVVTDKSEADDIDRLIQLVASRCDRELLLRHASPDHEKHTHSATRMSSTGSRCQRVPRGARQRVARRPRSNDRVPLAIHDPLHASSRA